MAAKLVCTLETAMYRVMQKKQYSTVASNTKVFMKLVGGYYSATSDYLNDYLFNTKFKI